MAITWEELCNNFERYKKILPPDEKVVFPRREALKRIANKEKRHRISFDADETTYEEFWAIWEAWMRELDENPTLVKHGIIKALKEFDVRGWKEQQEAEG